MKLRNTLITGFAALAIAAVGVRAQEIDTYSNSNGTGFNANGYNDDDLVLAFYSASDVSQSSGVNSTGDLEFDLGNVSSFTGLAAGTYSVAGFNGSTTSGQPAVGFGSADLTASLSVPSTSTYWTVMGSDTNTNELWLTGTTTQVRQSSSAQGTIAGRISAVGTTTSPNSDGSASDTNQTAEGYLSINGAWPGTAVVQSPVSSSSNQMGLYALQPGTGSGGSVTELGYFTLADNSGTFSLDFTSITAIPEPSTYAAILGALTIGFVVVRRRFNAGSLNALV
jgi:hypothetical protein